MTNQEPLTAERDIDDFVAEAISIIATTDDLMDTDLAPVFKAYAAQELATVTNERDALREYAGHKVGCLYSHGPTTYNAGNCTCGFEALAQKGPNP